MHDHTQQRIGKAVRLSESWLENVYYVYYYSFHYDEIMGNFMIDLL
tara:strand:+ start:139 stop:276 length:138 start_codon:yes stop_codon:yes gene_type:complete